MSNGKLVITPVENGVIFDVAGRANFETAMPLREFVEKSFSFRNIYFALKECAMFDSTFMGVMAMMALKARRSGGTVFLYEADSKLRGLLNSIGILKLFSTAETLPRVAAAGEAVNAAPQTEEARAQTVLDAHRTLVEADQKNAEVFQTVIELAEDDVNRLKNNQ